MNQVIKFLVQRKALQMFRTNSSQSEQLDIQTITTSATTVEGIRSSYRQTYREIGDQHVVETDVLAQLRANMAQLEDLHGRMKFMMVEVSYLLKKS